MDLRSLLLFAFLASALLLGCTSEVEEPTLAFVQPEDFPDPTFTFDNNPVTREKFELGKRLFFDPMLSRDNSIACSSCHAQEVAFADPQHALSIGVDDQFGKRNAPAIMNLAFRKHFFWDGGVVHMDFIPINAIQNPVEMDEKMGNVIGKLNASPSYVEDFSDAFEVDSITSPLVLQAISQYMLQLVSDDSPYDKYNRGNKTALTNDQIEGLAIFKQKCTACHSGALFTDQSFSNNGLDADFNDDAGRALITELEEDKGKFSVPSLRNVALTAPYMHDGRFRTLEEVMDHYDDKVKLSPSLDERLIQSDKALGIPLDQEEKRLIITFLKGLTDEKFITEPLYQRN